MDWIYLAEEGIIGGSCERGNEPSASVRLWLNSLAAQWQRLRNGSAPLS
jgi:hypothetical protein